jgi:hypothetical protein
MKRENNNANKKENRRKGNENKPIKSLLINEIITHFWIKNSQS